MHSPGTGIVDFGAVADAYAEDLRGAGGSLALGCEVLGLEASSRSLRVRHARGVTEAGHAICCAGAWSDRLAVAAGADPDPRIVPFRGNYLKLVPEKRDLVRSLVYPVPDPALPFLGVHLTRQIDGEVLIGPTALLGASGLGRTARLAGLVADVPPLVADRREPSCATRSPAAPSSRPPPATCPSSRPPTSSPPSPACAPRPSAATAACSTTSPSRRTERALHVRNAPSPAATSSLAIAAPRRRRSRTPLLRRR